MRRCWAAVALLFGISGLAHAERIICIGDSITQGGARSQDYTYRLPLQSMLNADFIGTRRTGLDPEVKWPDGFDPDHEGYYGATSAQVRDHLKLTLPRLPPPDLALVYLGTNDGFGETVEPLESIIRQLRARNPQVRVFVGVAIHGWKSLYMEITLGRMARRLGVTLVRHTYTLVDTFDGVHPNPSGQLKMAAAWFAAISRKDSNDKVEKVARLGSGSGWIVGRDVERRMGRSRSIGKLDGLRPDMGRKYLTTVVATLWPKHGADDPEGGRAPGIDKADARNAFQTLTETEADVREAARGAQEGRRRAYHRAARPIATATGAVATIGCRCLGSKMGVP